MLSMQSVAHAADQWALGDMNGALVQYTPHCLMLNEKNNSKIYFRIYILDAHKGCLSHVRPIKYLY